MNGATIIGVGWLGSVICGGLSDHLTGFSGQFSGTPVGFVLGVLIGGMGGIFIAIIISLPRC